MIKLGRNINIRDFFLAQLGRYHQRILQVNFATGCSDLYSHMQVTIDNALLCSGANAVCERTSDGHKAQRVISFVPRLCGGYQDVMSTLFRLW